LRVDFRQKGRNQMKRFSKVVLVTCVTALALAAVSTAAAQAAPRFTWSATGELTGTQTSDQVFTPEAGGKGSVTCKKADATGTILSSEAVELRFRVAYSECTAATSVGTVAATVSGAEYDAKAAGGVEILSTITINAKGGLINCSIVVGPQTPTGGVTYDSAAGKIEETSAVTAIVSSSSGLCPKGSTGTYTGSFLLERVGGGTIAWDAK
jgi:hypothetical protein